ncbi:MAG TPA: FAD-dependent monooxygenase [Polyangiaceae bacterium]|nr:FAD-dependent monooxygenase [Polyangiaceae bacterium]
MTWPTQVEIELGLDDPDDDLALRAAVARKLGTSAASLPTLAVRRRALDSRRGRPRFHLLIQIAAGDPQSALHAAAPREVDTQRRVVIVGAGPAGLFCAYQLARFGIGCTVVDRGKLVQPRRRDLKGLTRHGKVDEDSNYCFGEGGAGTYSDGKLYTRADKRGNVRDVLEILVQHGAPAEILIDARPHVGSNRLPKVVTALRERLQSVGVEFLFGKRVTGLLLSKDSPAKGGKTRNDADRHIAGVAFSDGTQLEAQQVVMATGHSARDVQQLLLEAGEPLEAKPFALGVRIEHPQPLINKIQYGRFSGHPRLPAASYRLASNLGDSKVFSFCMCPGGFVVPSMTEAGSIVVNGMSLSKRNSPFANSGFVVGLEPHHFDQAGFHGPLGGVALQQAIERAAFAAGNAMLAAPATRMTDFLAGRGSTTVPKSSYVPGLVAADLAPVLNATGLPLAAQLQAALKDIGKKMPQYLSEEAVLIGVESRTSSPVRVVRDPETLMSPKTQGLYPCAEGAGYAGGILSAALDGMNVAHKIAASLQ